MPPSQSQTVSWIYPFQCKICHASVNGDSVTWAWHTVTLIDYWLSPNSITPTFTETSLRGKSWTQVMKVADTNCLDMSRCFWQSSWQVRDKCVCVVLMDFSSLQCTGKVGDKVRGNKSWKFATQIMKVGDMICVTDFHNLCSRLSPRLSFGESCKVSVTEFGL